MKKDEKSVVYKILRLLRGNVIKILVTLSEEEKLKWKEIQEITKLPTATLNRSLSALQEIHFIEKENKHYRLSWAGKLAIEGLILLGLKVEEYPSKEKIEDFVAEKILAQNIVLAMLVILLASIRLRGNLNLEEFEKDLENEKEVIYKVIKDYEKDGYLKIDGKKIIATEKFKKIKLQDLLSGLF